ncbi:MAG: RIIB Protector from prophage-induced early lysis [Candidatus Gottesmanbacteria bacterium GW2011_GWB1_49_7]|uniref:RIIB Protector from prophage-induced early lysis n=1 Tax=Candidatus Gottesmanbacteria bacterium GW2011_GWB1_49_7 TaxID=1618448 RepID=A0A0G1W240_9BACT|nr:MAG: RIIB Protector from prophage-induced early lysis [Candidatus Gottesmanbacteria bacterium GW2011_GWB1_49_7]
MSNITYSMTPGSVTVVVDGKATVVSSSAPNYKKLCTHLVNEEWNLVPSCLTPAKTIESWANGQFKVVDGSILFKGEVIDPKLSKRIMSMAGRNEDPWPWIKFWERLQLNPSWRSVKQLYGFMEHDQIPIDESGFVIAYKSVRNDWMDHHSGTILNKPGEKPTFPRNKISDDPDVACHEGLHIGSLKYARDFGQVSSKIVVCRIDPADVVCIPKDCSMQKMRVCSYEVLGVHGAPLPSTTIKSEDLGVRTPVKETTPPKKVAPAEKESAKTDTKKAKPEKPSTTKSLDGDKTWSYMDKYNEAKLMESSLEDLRKYAAFGLHITGASKITGGKAALVKKILDVRN